MTVPRPNWWPWSPNSRGNHACSGPLIRGLHRRLLGCSTGRTDSRPVEWARRLASVRWAGCIDRFAPYHLLMVVVRCEECPLFPLLNASLRSWRNCYCDHDDRWHDCARYKRALSGRQVPISLLPNGKDALHLRSAPSADRVASAPRPAPMSGLQSGPLQGTMLKSLFEPPPEPRRPTESSAPAKIAQPPRHAPVPRRRWWTRLANWLRGTA